MVLHQKVYRYFPSWFFVFFFFYNIPSAFLYKLNSRNLDYGVYDDAQKGFIGIRTKFGSRYLFTEYHWDTGSPFGTAMPIKEMKQCPIKKVRESFNPGLFEWLMSEGVLIHDTT